ncbi:hypothetical protein F4553_000211 [Allocatelliglobosispora scoriae]|uniref:Protein kinase domain-containing protein n=1 Tax=Allocatelliglobosispora scoriae TaxID=643052 RepID=A0A841BJ76_9ACTN|nr:protein kinase [Allocatelliglobosispora scoriae]MBB5866832.1 hypothetical protein [Allocatelliglobosispora scoriae]
MTKVDERVPVQLDATRVEYGAASPSPAELPEPVLARFQAVSYLGDGGETQGVWLVTDRSSGQHRVVKVYKESVRPNDELLQLLRVPPDGALSPHLVGLYEWGVHTNAWGATRCWEVQEFAAHGSLLQLAQTEGPKLPEALVRTVLMQVTEALTYLHTQIRTGRGTGLAHRDIKPDNILVRRREPLRLVLGDFGLVTAVRATRISNGTGGSPLYQAPETFHRMSEGLQQDWWSLGIMLVELLTGRNPNYGAGAGNDPRALYEHLTSYDVDLSRVTDPRWHLLCRGLLTREPTLRWGAAEVREWLAGQSPTVHATKGRIVRPFLVAGTPCATPAQLAATMSAHWSSATAHVRDPGWLAGLRQWLEQEHPDTRLPQSLLAAAVTTEAQADLRIAQIIAVIDPKLPPVFRGHPADAAGLARLAQAAQRHDQAAVAVIGAIGRDLLAALAQHRCTGRHPGCTGPLGCRVLAEAARELPDARSALAQRTAALLVHVGSLPELAPAQAVLFRALVDPDFRAKLAKALRRGPSTVPWWAALAAESKNALTAGGRIAAAVLASLLVDLASAQAARLQGTPAPGGAAPWQVQRPAGWNVVVAGLRAAVADLVNIAMMVALLYLTTFTVHLGYRLVDTDFDWGRTTALAGQFGAVQAVVLPPIALVMALLLIRPADPRAVTGRLRLLILLVAAGIVTAIHFHREEWLRFPVVIAPQNFAWLADFHAFLGSGTIPVIGAVYLPVIVVLLVQLGSRGRRTPSGGRYRVMTAVRTLTALAVVTLFVLGAVGWAPVTQFAENPLLLWE